MLGITPLDIRTASEVRVDTYVEEIELQAAGNRSGSVFSDFSFEGQRPGTSTRYDHENYATFIRDIFMFMAYPKLYDRYYKRRIY